MEDAMHRDWGELAKFYTQLAPRSSDLQAALNGLSALCTAVSKSHLASGLFAHTSMHDLLISQMPTAYPAPLGTQWLIIQPRPNGFLEVSLKREGLANREGDWSRTAPSQEMVRYFNKLLRQLGWNYHPILE